MFKVCWPLRRPSRGSRCCFGRGGDRPIDDIGDRKDKQIRLAWISVGSKVLILSAAGVPTLH